MKKFTNNQRLKMIDLHFKDGWAIKDIAKKFNADYSHIKELISFYSYHGFDAIKLKSKYVCYTKEEKERKQKIVAAVQEIRLKNNYS